MSLAIWRAARLALLAVFVVASTGQPPVPVKQRRSGKESAAATGSAARHQQPVVEALASAAG